jgi:hypothetical protein
MMDARNHLLTLAEAGRRLGLAARTVRRLADRGAIEIVYPCANTPRIAESEITRYIEELHSGRKSWRNKKRKDTPASTPGQIANTSVSTTTTAREELEKLLNIVPTAAKRPDSKRPLSGRKR